MADKKRLTYEPPRAIRMGEMTGAQGQNGLIACEQAGSGDAFRCVGPGNSANGVGCGNPGNSAGMCDLTGNSPSTVLGCGGPGNLVVVFACFEPGSSHSGPF